MRRLLLALVFSFSLGCMGAINGLTGLDLDMQVGEASVHPTSFVVQPVDGEKLMSMGMTADSDSLNLPPEVDVDLSELDQVRMDLITYKVSDLDAAATKAIGELEAGGYERQTSDDPAVDVFRKGTMLFVLARSDEGGEKSLSLIQLEPRAAEPGGAVEKAE